MLALVAILLLDYLSPAILFWTGQVIRFVIVFDEGNVAVKVVELVSNCVTIELSSLCRKGKLVKEFRDQPRLVLGPVLPCSVIDGLELLIFVGSKGFVPLLQLD